MFDVVVKRACAIVFCLLALPAQAWAGARDFEMPAPVAAAAARSGAYKSPVLRAPERFDLVGMRWPGRLRPTISLRAKLVSGRWTKWTRVPVEADHGPDRGAGEATRGTTSAPVWTGKARYVQYHLSRRLPGLRLHFVRASAPRRPARLARARAADGQPAIQPRAAWGAEDCVPREPAVFGGVQMAFVHHTVSANEYTAAEVPSIVLSICRYHRNSNGWNDIGYNFLVDKYGTLWEGRAGGIDQAVVGAQAQGYNSQSTGIAEIGTHADVPASTATLDAIARLVRWKLPLHGSPTAGTVTLTSAGGSQNRYRSGTQVTFERVSGHRDADSTSCPGDAFYAQLPDLRARVGDVQPTQGAQARTRIDASITPATVVYPAQATISGVVRQVNGDPVAGVPLAVEALGASGWRSTWSATTGDDGGFRLDVGARLSHKVRVKFAGDAGRLPSYSNSMLLKVVPELTLARSASRRPLGETVTLSGTVQPNKTRLVLIVERRAGKQRDRGVLNVRARRGRFARTYRFHSTGLFRFYVAFKGDAGNAPAESAAVYVRAVPAMQRGGGVSAEAAARRR